jgi:lipopolysaccharide biosynthesis regulator YciM
MTLILLLVLPALAAYFGWLAGRRWERGKIEVEQAKYAEIAAKRSGGMKLTTLRIRR